MSARSVVVICLACIFGVMGAAASGYGRGTGKMATTGFDYVYDDSVSAASLVAADLNNDNATDLVVAGGNSGYYDIYFLWGDGAGGLDYPSLMYHNARRAVPAVGFVDPDTLLDVLWVTTDSLFVMLPALDYSVQKQPVGNAGTFPSLATGYFNADQYLDVVTSPGKVWFGDGSGLFGSSHAIDSSEVVGTNDYTSDGHDDIISIKGDTILLLINDSTGNFTRSPWKFYMGLSSVNNRNCYRYFLTHVDFNGDGIPDFVTTSYSNTLIGKIWVGLGTGSMGFTGLDASAPMSQIAGQITQVTTGDFDRDGHLDVAVVETAVPPKVIVYFGDGTGQFPDSLALSTFDMSTSPAFWGLASTDFDRDGNMDVAVGTGRGAPLLRLMNQLPARPTLADEMTVTAFSGRKKNLALGTMADPISGSGIPVVNIAICNPDSQVISMNYTTVAGAEYWQVDADQNDTVDSRTYDNGVLEGEYELIITPNPGADPGGCYTTDIRIDGSRYARLFLAYPSPGSVVNEATIATPMPDTILFYYKVENVSSISPDNGAPVSINRPQFKWDRLMPPEAGKTYQFQLDRYHDIRSPIYNISGLTLPTFTPSVTLGQDSVFYWRVRSYKTGVWSDWSRVFAAYITGCCAGITGNVTSTGIIDLADLSMLIAYLTASPRPVLPCPAEANINNVGIIDLADLSLLIAYLTATPRPVLPNCP